MKNEAEVWTVVSGILNIILEDDKLIRGKGQSVRIPKVIDIELGMKRHEPVIFIEVQTGSYFGEDDIIRIEDDYNRD